MTVDYHIDSLPKMSWNFTKLRLNLERRLFDISKQYRGVMVAGSGGLDSTVLFHLFCEILKGKKNFELGLIHVNYRLRDEDSQLDQHFVEEMAKAAEVPLYLHVASDSELQQVEDESGIQVWARRIRQAIFYDFSKEGYLIALGHHQGDLAENAILRLSRGTSVGTMAGMREFAPPFWRPLLSVSKEDLQNYAEKHSIQYRHDASNDKIIYSRNLIRHRLIPELERLYPKASKRIAELAIEGQELAEFCREKLVEELDAYGSKIPATFVTNKPKALAFAAISLMFSRVGRPGKQYSRQILGLIFAKLNENSGKKQWQFNVAGGLIFFFDHGLIRVGNELFLRKFIATNEIHSVVKLRTAGDQNGKVPGK